MSLKKSDLVSIYDNFRMSLNPQTAASVLKCTGRGGKDHASRDYVQANALLAEVSKVRPLSPQDTPSSLWGTLNAATRFRLQHYTPCLAARFDELKSDAQLELFNDPKWVFTEKMNGVRAWVMCLPNHGWHVYSRNYSDIDCGLLDYAPNITPAPADYGLCVLDCELVFEPSVDLSKDLEELGLSTDSPLEAMVSLLHMEKDAALAIQNKYATKYGHPLVCFRLIAPLYLNGVNYISQPLGAGMDVYDTALGYAQGLGLNIKGIKRCSGGREEKEIFLDTILKSGGEGVVAHNRTGEYCTSENRSKTSYVKIKRSVSSSTKLGDTFDCFVSGYVLGNAGTVNEGIIASFEFSAYVLDSSGWRFLKHLATVSGIDRATRKDATWDNPNGLCPQQWVDSAGISHWVSMNPVYEGMVAELDGQALSPVSQRLEHARIVRWRSERSAESCVYTQDFINSQTTNVGIKYSNS